MRTVLVALTTLAAIPLVVLGLLGIILGACWYGTGGWWLGMGIYAMLQASVPCLMLLARTLLRKHEK
jgi:integral membrane sensor domain MASE1